MNILFVCTGNTCRSPMAEAIFNHLSGGRAKAESAGLFAAEGQSASAHVSAIFEEEGIVHAHRSKSVREEAIRQADYIFAMTGSHKESLMRSWPGAADRIFTLKEFVLEDSGNQDVIDPFGGNAAVYKQTYEELEELIKQLIKKLDLEHNEPADK